MKKTLIIFLLINTILSEFDESKVIIIYFTKTGTTEKFAEYIQEFIDVDSYKIVPLIEYPAESEKMTIIAKEERENNTRPEIKEPLTDISKYDIILLGYPLWNGDIPNILITQLELLGENLKGKKIYPFNTHGSSGIQNSVNTIKKYSVGAEVEEGFAITQNDILNEKEISKNEINKWLNKNFGFTPEEDYSKYIKLNYFISILLYILL